MRGLTDPSSYSSNNVTELAHSFALRARQSISPCGLFGKLVNICIGFNVQGREYITITQPSITSSLSTAVGWHPHDSLEVVLRSGTQGSPYSG